MRAFNEVGFGISITVNSNAFTFLKFSIGLCLLRLRAGIGRWYTWTIWVALGKSPTIPASSFLWF
jgi:hypothetical protein